MSSKVTVFTTEEFHAAVVNSPDTVLTIEKKKNSKSFKGTEFLNAYFNVGPHQKKEGWVNIKNIELSDGVADPANKEDKRNEHEGTRMQLQTTLSRSGQLGAAFAALNPVWRKTVTDLAAKGVIDLDGRKIHDIVQFNLSKQNIKNPGGKIEDPVLRFQIDFAIFPEKYPHAFLRGQQKTQFLDARTAYKDARNVTQYKPATVNVDGKEVPVNADNLHLFVTRGSKIVEGRIMLPSVPVSQSWVSIPITINRCVLLPGGDGGFSDEADDSFDTTTMQNALVSAAIQTPEQTAATEVPASPAAAPPGSPAQAPAADGDAVDDLLNGL